VFEKGFVRFILDGQGKVDLMKLHVSGYVEPSEYTFRKLNAHSSPQ
jgi:hypothetical protein